MTRLLDVVNFNADASCLESGRWLDALTGGDRSEMVRWLRLYVQLGRKVVIGFTGATLADLAVHNPEALALVRAHADVFDTVARPFSHDVALIRNPSAFAINLEFGIRASLAALGLTSHSYLPPEFMLSNEQIGLLSARGVRRVFVNADRLAVNIRARIPRVPYWVKGVAGSRLGCLPVTGMLTKSYLDTLHGFDATSWNSAMATAGDLVVAWRDGESPLLFPNGLAREEYWLTHEADVDRCHLRDLEFDFVDTERLPADLLRSYPVHSFEAWMKEFRMLGYLGRLQRLEDLVEQFSSPELALWFQAINSDVLSAVEKRPVSVRLRASPDARSAVVHTLLRSERGFEGEEYLHLLEHARGGDTIALATFLGTNEPHAAKLRGRLQFLHTLTAQDGGVD